MGESSESFFHVKALKATALFDTFYFFPLSWYDIVIYKNIYLVFIPFSGTELLKPLEFPK